MGFVGSLFSGDKGMGWEASGTNIQQPVSVAEAQNASQNVDNSLRKQNDFYNALQAQNGIGNQSNVFAQQQALANQLGQAVQGSGPSVAETQLANTTGQNVANQAALMAGTRGSGANVGLMARQIANQGANTQQQAAGQAAQLRAQEQLQARQQLQQQQGMMAGLAGQQVGQQQGALGQMQQGALANQANMLGSIDAANRNRVAMQSNMNQANAAINQTTAQGQQGILGGVMQGIGAMVGLAHGGQVPNYYADGGVAPQSPTVPPASASSVQKPAAVDPNAPQSFYGKFFKGFSGTKDSGQADPNSSMGQMGGNSSGAQALNKGVEQMMAGIGKGAKSMFASDSGIQLGSQFSGAENAPNLGIEGLDKPKASPFSLGADTKLPPVQNFADGGGAEALAKGFSGLLGSLNPMKAMSGAMGGGEGGDDEGGGGGALGGIMKMAPMLAAALNKGGPIKGEQFAAKGKLVPGKAKVKGDSLKNDTVPAMLSPGEVIIPKSVMESRDPVKNAAAFVAQVLAKQASKRK